MHNGAALKFNPSPTYLGATLDRSVTFHPRLLNVAEETSKRVNLIKKVAGTNWGANYTTLRISLLALVHSTAEYAAPVWAHSRHTKLVDVVLNEALRIVSGTMMSTQVDMLPILSVIAFNRLQREFLLLKLAAKSDQPGDCLSPSLPGT